MRLEVKGKNVAVAPDVRDYAERKMGKLAKQLAEPTRVEVELAVERNPSIADNHIAEATIWTKGPVLRAREAAPDMRVSIDRLVDKLERQVTRYRQKRRHEHERHDVPEELTSPTSLRPEEDAVIVKKKQFALDPMTPEEAIVQLELIGHDFFVFRDLGSGEVNVLYRRLDGDYGLIEPSQARPA